MNITEMEFYLGLAVSAAVVISVAIAMLISVFRTYVRHTDLTKQLEKSRGEMNAKIAENEDKTTDQITEMLVSISEQGNRLSDAEDKAREK